MSVLLSPFEKRFLDALDHHLQGLADKVERDFALDNLNAEVAALQSDRVYRELGFDIPEYALVRLVGRISISVGRRLGEIYDKVPRFVAAARFKVDPADIAEKFDGLELDIALRYERLANDGDRAHVAELIKGLAGPDCAGVGIEIRYNFNPNDSSRLRKDVDVASKLKEAGLCPVYLIFSALSPRDEAIARLKRGGWSFFQGPDALAFLNTLLGVDISAVLSDPAISARTRAKTEEIMKSVFSSPAFRSLA